MLASKQQEPTKVYYSYADMCEDLGIIKDQIATTNWKPDMIIGLTRGGLVPAVMLSHFYDVPLVPVNLSLRDFRNDLDNVISEIRQTVGLDNLQNKNILVVDDIVDSGETLLELHKIFQSLLLSYEQYNFDHIKSAVLYYNCSNKAKIVPEFYGRLIDKTKQNDWIVFTAFEAWWK